ncbi:MAG: amino acid ABC transporter ATP-binding/permease protein, partial [Gammaproteobacteria bacterium]
SLPLPKHFDLTVERVSFRYPDRNDRILNDIDLAIPQGTKIAVVGPSGCGKTTLLHLLMRYYDPEQGRIALAGRDYRHYSSARLTDTFAVMTQHNHLFAASLKENLLIAKLDADDQELAAALAIAGLGNWLGKLPDGFDTWVGEHGIRVSGGEARRIALARLYLKNTPLLFLDEPTEGLDADTERDVLEALAVFSEGKTVIMTTHRQAGLDLVDRVYEIDGGTLRRKPKTL